MITRRQTIWLLAGLLGLTVVCHADLIHFDFHPDHVVPPNLMGRPAPKSFTVPRTALPPNIDGLAHDPAWEDAPVLPELGIPDPVTRVRILYDDVAVYFLIECADEEGWPSVAKLRPRDADMREDDVVDIALNPTLKSADGYLFRINAAGSVYDARDHDPAWDPEWQHAVQRSGRGWTVEAAISFAVLGLSGPPARLGFNLSRQGPRVMVRSWYNFQHRSAMDSLLRFAGVEEATAPPPPPVEYPPEVSVHGESLTLFPDRIEARPFDRWIDVTMLLSPDSDLHHTRLDAALFELAGREPVATVSVVPENTCGRLAVDLRTAGLSKARLSLHYFEGAECTARAEMFLGAAARADLPRHELVPVLIDLPAGTEAGDISPLTFGVPFPAGALWDIGDLSLVDRSGREIPSQKEITGLWARDGAIQWVRFDALADADAGCFLRFAPATATPATPLTVREQGDRIVLNTGISTFILSAEGSPIAEVLQNGRRIASSAGTRGLYVIDQAGRLAMASSEGTTVRIEAAGPVAGCVRIEGDYRTAEGEAVARHITRIEAFAGQPFASITHTLVITRDTADIWFREVGWELAVEAGTAPRAVFNTDRSDTGQVVVAALAEGESATMFQAEHTRFGTGENRFSVVAGEQILAEGAECGDWALLTGAQGSLMMACRESARQHPKEFEISSDRIVLRLFSNRAGEELDFRPVTLARKWNLSDQLAEDVAKVRSNAAGWSKTHELRLWPSTAPRSAEEAARLARLHAEPVLALVDPHWIWRSRAMGPLHPRDTESFPEAEALIDRVFAAIEPRGHATGHYGFMDYFAGPTYGGVGHCRAGRYRFTYGLRWSLWLIYARSGDRALRHFAEATNKAFLDNYLCHWDVPGKTRGIFTRSGGQPANGLPFYWGTGSAFNYSSSTDLNQFVWMYQLCGYRRARDAMEAFAAGLKAAWKPDMADWRKIMVLRVLTQTYGFTWDPRLRALAEGTFDSLVDRHSDVLLTKKRPYSSSTYKTKEDLPALIETWRLLGADKYREVAQAVAQYWWNEVIGTQPITRMNPLGIVGEFLYEQTDDPAILTAVDYGLRRAGTYRSAVGTSMIAGVFENLPYSMDVARRACPETGPPWIAYRDYGNPASVLALKPNDGVLDLTVRTPTEGVGRQFELRPAGIPPGFGLDLHSVRQRAHGAGTARVPIDAPGSAWEVVPANEGEHFVQASQRVPLVLYATSYWSLPQIFPVVPVYFNVPADAENAQIFFEGPARLFDPDGNAFGAPEGVRGEVRLPSDRPGLWRFEPVSNRLVRGWNFPPFFAMGAPEFYFEPPVPWELQPLPPPSIETPAGTLYMPGPIEEEDDQALFLGGKHTFTVDGGGDHPEGNGSRFLPHRAGTIEFFFRPDWSTFDLGEEAVARTFLRVVTDTSPWILQYRIDPEGTAVNLGPKDPSHSLYGSMHLENGAHLRVWRTQTIFDRADWVHLAFVWGPEIRYGPRRDKLSLMVLRMYVNGKGRAATIFRSAVDMLAAGQPQRLTIGPLQGAAIAQLRISDIQRYTEDFAPVFTRQPACDEHTRAVFRFRGTLDGESHCDGDAPVGIVSE